MDEIFAYDTVQFCRVVDRRLGLVYYNVLFVVITYFLFVFIMWEGYLEEEKTSGTVIAKVLNSQKSDIGISWDVFDKTTNPGEEGAVFIPTRILITKGQTQEDQYCESPHHNCTSDSDCDIGNVVLQKAQCSNGRCLRRLWCPAEDPDAATTETHYLDYEDVMLWFQAYVHFRNFMLDVTTFDEKEEREYPFTRANSFPLHDILRMANIQYESIIEHGAIVLVNTIFFCNMNSETCETHVHSTNVDTSTGFNYQHDHVYYENGIRKRDTYRMYGIRLITFTTGFGKKTSFSKIVLQLSSAIALTNYATYAADACMLYLLPEKKHYREKKIETSHNVVESESEG